MSYLQWIHKKNLGLRLLLACLFSVCQVVVAGGVANLTNDVSEVLPEIGDNSFNQDDSYVSPYQFDDSLGSTESLWDRVRSGFSIPDIDSVYTSKHEQWYASRPDYMSRMLERTKKYLFHIVEEVEKRGMPTEIALLPMIESGYNPRALSSSKASGIWQFIPSTGNHFGLRQNYWADSRNDVKAATQAALNYLQKLHGMFGTWDLALAAYNAGEGTVARAIEKNRRLGLPTDYQHLSLPDETRNYVPKLQAIKNIVFSPGSYGLTLNEIPNRPYFSTVTAPKQIDAKLAAQLAGVSQDEFHALNPSFNKPVIIANADMQQLLLPTWAAANFVRNLAEYDKPLSQWQSYHPQRGERIGAIAEQFNISVYELCAINNLRPNKNLIPRRALLVPGNINPHLTRPIDVGAMSNYSLATREPAEQSLRHHTVKRGESLGQIAKRYGVSTQMILKENRLTRKQFKPGLWLRIPAKVIRHSTAAMRTTVGHSKHASKHGRAEGRHKRATVRSRSKSSVSNHKHRNSAASSGTKKGRSGHTH